MMERHDITIGENPVVSMDLVDGTVKFVWKTSLLKKTLDYKIEKCVGCSLCLPCPWEAITLGPVAETAAGRIENAPLVNVDPELCTFCGLCDSACVFRAFDASYEGEGAVNEFNRIDGTHEIDEEKCAPCLLCAKVCPTESLSVDINVSKKKDIVIYEGEESAEGRIRVDEDKCSYCGLCELLCPKAIKIYWSDSAEPPEFRPAIAIKVIEEECDYCGLCAKICPDEAIEVECTKSTPRTIGEIEITGQLHHDNETCVKCGLCGIVCPFEALTVTKPFSGEVIVNNLEKCDPTGCNNCFNICPTKSIYPTGTAEKLAVYDDNCIYCGACEHSCPYDVLKVKREGYNIEELERARKWEKARGLFFDAVIGIEPDPSGLFERSIVVKIREKVQVRIKEEQAWSSEDGARKQAMKAAQALRDLLRNDPQLQLQLEKGRVKEVVERFNETRGSSRKK